MEKKKKIGLFFGSFNPVHVGHMIIANFMAQRTDMDQVWMVVSPHNPLKAKSSLANDYERLHLVNLAIGDNPEIRVSDIEFSLPKPSYTIDTLTYLKEKYTDNRFALIMGGDNLRTLHKWKNPEMIRQHQIYIYERPGYDSQEFKDQEEFTFVEAPLLDISASYIRKSIKDGFSVQYLIPDKVFEYISSGNLYK
jgi:nicotinate-nucleotide adenylyltransferase